MCLTVLLGQCSGTRQVSLNKLSIWVSYSHSITRVAAKGTKKNLYHGRRQYANESSICMPSSYLREFDIKRKDTRSLMKLSIWVQLYGFRKRNMDKEYIYTNSSKELAFSHQIVFYTNLANFRLDIILYVYLCK